MYTYTSSKDTEGTDVSVCHTHTHTHTHTYTYTYTYTYTHTHAHARAHTYTHLCVLTFLNFCHFGESTCSDFALPKTRAKSEQVVLPNLKFENFRVAKSATVCLDCIRRCHGCRGFLVTVVTASLLLFRAEEAKMRNHRSFLLCLVMHL